MKKDAKNEAVLGRKQVKRSHVKSPPPKPCAKGKGRGKGS